MELNRGERIIKKYDLVSLSVHKSWYGYDWCKNDTPVTLSNHRLYIEAPERVDDLSKTMAKVIGTIGGAIFGIHGAGKAFSKSESGYDYTGGDIEIPLKAITGLKLRRETFLYTGVEIEYSDRTIALRFIRYGEEVTSEFINSLKKLSGINS